MQTVESCTSKRSIVPRAIAGTAISLFLVTIITVALTPHDPSPPTTSLSTQCTLQVRNLADGPDQQVKHTLFGHNQINGPVFPVPFDDKALTEAAKMMWAGMLRFPGGTVANYWFWPNATYIEPCKGNGQFTPSGSSAASAAAGVAITSKTMDYDYCNKKKVVDRLPADTFTIGRFNAGLGSASTVLSKEGHMYDINVLTATPAEITQQIYRLDFDRKHHGFAVRYLEFGNEFYLDVYRSWFPTGKEYMEKIEPAIRLARSVFPNVKIGVPFDYPTWLLSQSGQAGKTSQWNKALAQYSDLYDAVIIHDYSATTKTVDQAPAGLRRSALAAWADKSIDEMRMWLAKFLPGQSHEIWMTEWNYASWEGVPLVTEAPNDKNYKETIQNQGITGIYQVGYLLKMIESSQDTSQPHHVTGNHHLFNEQEGNGWGRGSGSFRMSNKRNDLVGSMVNGPGQMYSHLSYVAMHLSDRMHVVNMASCPTQSLKFLGTTSDLQCLYATAFRHSCRARAMPVFAIINRCTQDIYPLLPAATMTGANNQLRTITYSDSQNGSWLSMSEITSLDPSAIKYAHPWANGPINPRINSRSVTNEEVGTTVRVTVKALSLTFVEFKEPAIANSVPSTCPIPWR